jgi:hypothetical protein
MHVSNSSSTVSGNVSRNPFVRGESEISHLRCRPYESDERCPLMQRNLLNQNSVYLRNLPKTVEPKDDYRIFRDLHSVMSASNVESKQLPESNIMPISDDEYAKLCLTNKSFLELKICGRDEFNLIAEFLSPYELATFSSVSKISMYATQKLKTEAFKTYLELDNFNDSDINSCSYPMLLKWKKDKEYDCIFLPRNSADINVPTGYAEEYQVCTNILYESSKLSVFNVDLAYEYFNSESKKMVQHLKEVSVEDKVGTVKEFIENNSHMLIKQLASKCIGKPRQAIDLLSKIQDESQRLLLMKQVITILMIHLPEKELDMRLIFNTSSSLSDIDKEKALELFDAFKTVDTKSNLESNYGYSVDELRSRNYKELTFIKDCHRHIELRFSDLQTRIDNGEDIDVKKEVEDICERYLYEDFVPVRDIFKNKTPAYNTAYNRKMIVDANFYDGIERHLLIEREAILRTSSS